MSGCPQRSYANISAAAFSCLVAKAAEYGVIISGDSGSASAHGFDITWNYDRAAGDLTLQCTDKPFIIGCGTVNSRMDQVVNDCRGA